MAEGSYEYACMRAELLGIDIPNREEFLAQEQERLKTQEEEIIDKSIEELETAADDLTNTTGKLDELNHILSITQKKLNRFKTACGSLTNLLKIKVGHADSAESIPSKEAEAESTSETELDYNESQTVSAECPETVRNGTRKTDLTKALDNQVDKLDSMLMRADNAQYSMAHQNKQIKSFLK